MITKDFILSKLPPYTGSKKVLIDEQNTQDIIKGILDNHELYKNDYDKISEYFVGSNDINTAKNVYFFLKKNVPYYIEPTKLQTLRSPSAILSYKADCKAYANFVNGIFDSLNRKGIFKIPLAYRFASYKVNSNNPGHVFAVLYPGSNNEIWVDNVLDNFNEKKQPTYFKDKKIKMALVSMSGLDNKQPTLDELKNYRDKLVSIQAKLVNNGQIVPGNQNDLQMKVAINRVTKAIQYGNVASIGDDKTNQMISTAASLIPVPGLSQLVDSFLPIVQGFFSNKANPNDWKGWDALDIRNKQPLGTSAAYWVNRDGDSVSNEASNILSYIVANDINKVTSNGVTFDNIIAKLRKGGLNQEADTLIKKQNPISNFFAPLTDNTKKAGINPFVLLALAGAGIYFFTRKKSA